MANPTAQTRKMDAREQVKDEMEMPSTPMPSVSKGEMEMTNAFCVLPLKGGNEDEGVDEGGNEDEGVDDTEMKKWHCCGYYCSICIPCCYINYNYNSACRKKYRSMKNNKCVSCICCIACNNPCTVYLCEMFCGKDITDSR